MTRLGFAGAVLAIVAIAAWAYNVNYRTKTTLGRIDDLRGRIAAEREHIQVLEVEWAWLNNPDRLARLAAENADRLGLAPMAPEHFGRVAAVPFPPAEPSVSVTAEAAAGQGAPGAADEVLAELALAAGAGVAPVPRPSLKAGE